MTLERNFSHVPIEAFLGGPESLYATAENLFFEACGCLPDLDKSGNCVLAQHAADQLIERAARG